MQIEQLISVIDAHTTGTPIRIVVSGIPRLHGKTVGEKMEYMRANFDWIRTSLLQQPRGFTSLVAAVLTEPVSEEADYGLFYMDDLTYQPMCGAGTLAVAKALVSVGMVPVKEPATEVVLETPTGLVRVSVAIENGNPGRVSLRNIPAFLYRKDLELEVPEVGHLTVDIGYGGNFFVLTDISQIQTPLIHGKIKKEQMSELRRLSRLILQEANKNIQVVHPENPAINYLDQLLYYSTKAEEDGSYLAQCIFGDAQADISPCGTGTSTRLAQKYFRGELKVGDTYRQKSVCGGVFEGKVSETAKAGDLPAIIPVVSCADIHLTGFNQLFLEKDDKLKYGFTSW